MQRRWIGCCCLCLSAGGPAAALTDEEVFRDFRFNLINPGARSLALGGAFISLADDATAAQANPAGLGFLRRPEYFAELRLVDNGAQSAVVSESLPGGSSSFVATGTDLDDTVTPSFVSAVMTFDRWSLGISRQEVLNIENTTVSSFAFTFEDSPGAFLAEGQGSIDVAVTNVNASFGFRATDRLGLGATLTYSTLDVDSQVVNSIVDTSGTVAGQEILEPTLDLRTSVNDDDDDFAYALGIIYKSQGKWHVGAVYRYAPSFSVDEIVDPAQDLDGDGSMDVGIDVFDVRGEIGSRYANEFGLPDVLGVGASWLPLASERLTLSADVERIRYSNLLSGYIAGVNMLTEPPDAVFTIDDATDYHLGSEYLFFNDKNALPPLALRAGTFLESDTTIQAVSTGSGSLGSPEVFRGRDDQLHGALGLGLTMQRWKIDLAADFAESDYEYLVSLIFQGK